ncbi:MAG TPA: 30S ribosomal protein S9, partial [Candidatus Acidoferrum sp.]|nr:30S ribosomal protein S9 [Candidatus Acidoferrum sp.]
MATQTQEFLGTGRRKTSVARVRLAAGSGKVTINGRPLENYFTVETQRETAISPLNLTQLLTKYDARINVDGGGMSG